MGRPRPWRERLMGQLIVDNPDCWSRRGGNPVARAGGFGSARGARPDAKVTAEGASETPRKNENQCFFYSLPVRAIDKEGHIDVRGPHRSS